MSSSTGTSVPLGVETRPAAPPPSRARTRRRRLLIAGSALVVLVAALGLLRPVERVRRLFGGATDNAVVYTVKPVTLNISLKEDGELKAVNSVDIKCEVQGERVTIEHVVDESSRVTKGDLLVKLASADMKDRVDTEEIELRGITAALEDARQALKITLSENESALKKARIDFEVAELELRGYVEGDYEKALKTANINKLQTRMDLDRKEEELAKSEPLLEKGFITPTKIQELKDEIEKLKMTLERNELELHTLDAIDREKNLKQKRSAVDQAREELEREEQRAQSREKQAQAKVQDQEQALTIRQRRFERLKEQLAKCEIVAPSDGVVQYGESGERRYWSNNRIAAGETVYPGQTILTIPDTSQMMVSTRIHEADRHKVSEGLACVVTVPAVPGKSFTGKLTKITRFADSERGWLNPNLKEHAAEIRLDETDPALSPGDTAHVEIMIEEVPDVLAVPVQCVFTRGGQHFVFVRKGLSATPVEVQLGRSTATMAEVPAGLAVGDHVLMAPDERLQAMLPTPSTTQPAAAPAATPTKGARPGQPFSVASAESRSSTRHS